MHKNLSYTTYVIGYIASLALTGAAYWLAQEHISSGHYAVSHGMLTFGVIAFALIQLVVQLVAFLHLGREGRPYWNLGAFLYASLLVIILVGGSLWIMYHLDYNMMLIPPAEMDAHMLE